MKRRIASEIQESYQISERHACRLIGISQNSKRYKPVDKSNDEQITERLIALSARWKRFGYRRLHIMLQREGIHINHKKTYRLYKAAGLSLPKRRLSERFFRQFDTKTQATLCVLTSIWGQNDGKTSAQTVCVDLISGCLNQHWFKNIPEARQIIENWRLEYNRIRPHSSLNNLTPEEYALELSSNY